MYLKTSEQEKLSLGYGNYSCNWGVHIAGLYETEEERDEIIFGYLSEGINKEDLQLYCPSERTESDFKEKFSHSCPDCKEHLDNKDIVQIFSAKDLYYPDGTFSPEAMDEGLNAFFENSQKDGKKNVRATAEMTWALEAIPGIEHLFAYESRLNYFIPNKPWISICMYNVTKFSGSYIMNVLRTHPYVLNKGTLMENPYFQNPDDWLKENAPQFIKKSEK